MESRTLLSLDMSTACTGWALFDSSSKELLSYGTIKPSTRGGVSKMTYPKQQLIKMIDIGTQILHLITSLKPNCIVIEEIAGSKNRLGQKTLDGLHWIVAWIIEDYLAVVNYYDVTGSSGWRTDLNLRLSEADKQANKESKILNKKLPSSQKIPTIGPKHLACRFSNSTFGTQFNFDLRETDGDQADAICMGYSFLLYRMPLSLK